MSKVSFDIGKAFPASDPVARFITVLAMMSNDWMRLAKQQIEVKDYYDDAEGIRIFSFRQQVALHFEAANFIRNTRQWFPDVERFVAALPAKVRRDCDRVVSGIDPKSKRYRGKWVENLRNTAFHYPKMQPDAAAHGQEPAANALNKAAKLTSTIEGGDVFFGEARFHFADEVVVQWIPEKGMRKTLSALGADAAALARFVQEAAMTYIEQTEKRSPGTFTLV
jgi:hypothetical protein